MGIDYKKFSQNLSQRRVSYYNIAMYDLFWDEWERRTCGI